MCNLYKPQCNIVIPKGFYKCRSCKGFGVLLTSPHYKQKHVMAYICAACNGNGYVDWVNNIRYNKPTKSSHYMYIPFRCPNDKKCQIVKNEVRKMNRRRKRDKRERKYLYAF